MFDGERRCPEHGLSSSESTLDSRPGDIRPDCWKEYLETTEADLHCPSVA